MNTCTGCGYQFELKDVARDPLFEPIGMQFEDVDHQYNFFYFNHVCENCGSTILLPVLDFLPLITEPVPDMVRTGLEDCERHCLRIDDLAECGAPCMYAPFRRLLLRMRDERQAVLARQKSGLSDPVQGDKKTEAA